MGPEAQEYELDRDSGGESGSDVTHVDGPEAALADSIMEAPANEAVETGKTANARGKPAQRASGFTQITADRPIFTLSVAADLLGLHPRTLRIYEEKRLVVPARTGGNRRRYSQNDIQRFQSIRRLTSGGVNLEGVRIILDMAVELATLGGDPNAVIERNLQTSDEP